MRKITAAAAFLATVLAGCKKSFLDLEPVSQVSTGNFYKTEKDIEQAVSGAYDAMQSTGEYGRNFVYFMEVVSDNSKTESITNSGGIYGDFDLFRVAPSNAVLDQTWKACYAGIQRCNIILNRIDAVSMDEATRAMRKGEVEFIRALTYFNLVRIWGDIPLVTEELSNPFDAFNHKREPVAKVYDQIISDLKDAAGKLPLVWSGNTNAGRASKGAAQALLGKVYLTLKNYSEAANILSAVVNSGTYSLLPVFGDVFKTTNKNNKESVFEVQFLKGGLGEGSIFANLFAPAGNNTLTGGIGSGSGDNVPTKNLISFFNSGPDPRRTATLDSLSDKRPYTKKYIDVPFQANDASNNFIVLRYADVLLMYAEALNEMGYNPAGNAFTSLNTVRTRAGAGTYTAASLPDQDAFRQAIDKERRLELAFENHRWFDLLRTGKTITVLNASGGGFTMQPHQLIFPIPQSQVDANPGVIIQNPGY